MKVKANLFAAVVLFCTVVLFTTIAFAATTYTVQRGDTLASIARQFNTTYPALAQANNIVNPNLIYVGQVLIVPDGSAPVATSVPSVPTSAPTQPPSGGAITHVVQRGDTISRIARAYGVSISAIVQTNRLSNPNIIYIGQVLRIPTVGLAVPTSIPTVIPPTSTSVPQATATTAPVQPTATTEPTPIPPTATNVPPTPTATATSAPAAPSGANLLVNPSVEGGHYNLNGLAELQVPDGWRLEWREGPNEFGTNDFRPETRVLSGIFLPPHERPMFIFEGWQTFKVFKGYGPINVSLLQDITLAPGTYQFEATVFPDQVASYEGGGKVYASPESAQVQLFTNNGQTTGWIFPTIGQANTLTFQFTVDSTQTVTVGVGLLGRYGLINNGFFVDNMKLRVVQ